MKSGIRRQSKAGEILASPTHRKLTPTHIRSNNSSPVKRLWKLNQNESKSLDRIEMPTSSGDDVHQHYKTLIENLKRSQEEKIKQLNYKIQMHEENLDADDEYLVSTENIQMHGALYIYFHRVIQTKSFTNILNTNNRILSKNLMLHVVFSPLHFLFYAFPSSLPSINSVNHNNIE